MKISFVMLCTTIVFTALLTAYGLAPLMWDAAGYIEGILNNVYHVDFTVEVR